jgi:hypothetical protein
MENDLRAPIKYTEWIQDGSDLNPVDREIPVVPITDKTLVSLPPEARSQAVSERALIYDMPFLEERFAIPLDQLRPETLELALVLEQVANREFEFEYYSKLREPERIAYEAEKIAIRAGKRGSKARDKKVSVLSEQFRERDSKLTDNSLTAESTKNLIIDEFIRTTFLTPNGAEAFSLSVQDLLEQSDFHVSAAVDLLKQARSRLETISDPDALRALSYKAEEGNLITAEEAEPLKQLVSLAVNDTDSSEIRQELSRTAKEILSFYWKNARMVSSADDKTPRVGLLHDVLLSACLTGDIKTVYAAVSYLGEKIDENVTDFAAELARNRDLHFSEHFKFLELLRDIKRQLGYKGDLNEFILTRDDQFFQQFNPVIRRAVSMGIYTDRSMAFDSFSILSRLVRGRNYHNILPNGKKVHSREEHEMVTTYADIFSHFDFKMSDTFPDARRVNAELAHRMDKKTYLDTMKVGLERTGKRWTAPRSVSDKESRERFIEKEALDFGNGADGRAFIAMFYDSGLESSQEMKNISEINSDLSRKIRDANLWFVAEQGDQFHVKNNPELNMHSIKSVTFTPNPNYEGTSVHVSTDLSFKGVPIEIDFVVTRSGAFIWDQFERLPIPQWASLPVENFMLKRLHYITSGALGDRLPHPKGETEEVESPTEARRSHWRVLTSKNGRVYTLNSPEAKRHAEYVLETYGIDIYDEILRRKQAGTLGKNQVITFVKAVIGKNEPNQLVYDEDKLKEFEATLPNVA